MLTACTITVSFVSLQPNATWKVEPKQAADQTLPPLNSAVYLKSSKFFQTPVKFNPSDSEEVDYADIIRKQNGDMSNLQDSDATYQSLLETYNGGVLTQGPKVTHPWVSSPYEAKLDKMKQATQDEEAGLIKRDTKQSSVSEGALSDGFATQRTLRRELAPRPPSHKRRVSPAPASRFPPAQAKRPSVTVTHKAAVAAAAASVESFSATFKAAAVPLDEGKRALAKNEIAKERLARDNSLLEDLATETKALLEDDVGKISPVFMPKPPTSTYEVCADLGVESPSLAAMCPPALLSPRYRAHNSPRPHVTPGLFLSIPRAGQVQPYVGMHLNS